MTDVGGPLVAIVPARGGSKRIPRKNIRPFLGVPLVARTIGMLLETRIFDRVVVSTDDDEIAAVAIDAGAAVPFMRDSDLADDSTATAPVVADAIRRLEASDSGVLDPVCAVYPAAVFIDELHLRAGVEQLLGTDADMVFAAAEFPAPIERAWRLGPSGHAEMVQPQHQLSRTQDLAPAFYDLGQFYWGRREHWLGGGRRSQRIGLHVMDGARVVDIDTEQDWQHAEELLAISELPDGEQAAR